jgi:hypothetical protein
MQQFTRNGAFFIWLFSTVSALLQLAKMNAPNSNHLINSIKGNGGSGKECFPALFFGTHRQDQNRRQQNHKLKHTSQAPS